MQSIHILLLTLLIQPAGTSFCPVEVWNPLPARTRGFVRDLRNVRLVAVLPNMPGSVQSLRGPYEQALALVPPKPKRLNAKPWGDDAALRLRLGDFAGAEETAREGLANFPTDFRLALLVALVAHAREDWVQAERAMALAISLAPTAEIKKNRLDHLAWLRARAKGVGPWLLELSKRLKGYDGLASAQEMCLLVPGDALLQLLVACRARDLGDPHGAIILVDGVAGESGIRNELVAKLRAELAPRVTAAAKASGAHLSHPTDLYRSDAPFAPNESLIVLPPVQNGVQPLPWALLGQSRMQKGNLRHSDILHKIDGKTIEIVGSTHFLGEEPPNGPVVLVELPYGCWHCDMPGLPGLLNLYMAEGQNIQPSREPVRMRGKLRLNRENPEDYLFSLEEASLVE